MPDPEEWERRLSHRKGVSCLPYHVQVAIPDKCSGCAEAYKKLRLGMTGLFGGTTVYDADGFWLDDKGSEIRDHVKIVESAHSCMSPEQGKRFEALVGTVTRMANQQALFIRSGQAMIVPRKAFHRMAHGID